MEELVISEVTQVLVDFKHGTQIYDGLIYMMFWELENLVTPLYIGKAGKIGRNGGLSANIKNITRNNAYFCRWGYNYAYHIGDLSAVVCNHVNNKTVRKYKNVFVKYAWLLHEYTVEKKNITPKCR